MRTLVAISETSFALPTGYRMERPGDAEARSATVGNLMASGRLIVTLSIATIALTFKSFPLTLVAFVVSGLSRSFQKAFCGNCGSKGVLLAAVSDRTARNKCQKRRPERGFPPKPGQD